MKKCLSALIALLTAVTLSSCGGKTDTFTIPDGLAYDEFDDLDEDKREGEIEDYSFGEDGALTLTLTDTQRRRLQSDVKEDILDETKDAEYGDDKVPSVVSIKPASDFSKFEVYVRADTFSPEYSALFHEIIKDSVLYKILDGTPADSANVTVSFIDNNTKAEIYSLSYKELN